MTMFKKPKSGESIRNENIVIGHLDNRIAVLRNEENELLFIYASSNEAEIGTVIENEYLAPIENLLPSEQKRIMNKYGN